MVKRNAALARKFGGPTVLDSNRRYLSARLAASSLSGDLARLVKEGWIESVDIRARCCGGGMNAGLSVEVEPPADARRRRRLRAWESTQLIRRSAVIGSKGAYKGPLRSK